MKTLPSIVILVCVACAVFTSGCKVGPDYYRPSITPPDSFRDGPATSDAASLSDRPWWEVFNDPTLVALIDQAIVSNHDVRIAVARIEQAWGVRAQTRSGLFPQVGYGAHSGRGRNDDFAERAEFNGNQTGNSSSLSLDALWEIDLWGRIRRADEAALARILAEEAIRRAILLTLVSDVAENYFTLLGLDLQKSVAMRNRDLFGQSLGTFEDRVRGGVESQLPVLRARASQSQAAAAIPQIERDIALTENQISILLGRPPQSVPRSIALNSLLPTLDVPVGVPSQLLERRPDIRAIEAQMIAANAEIGVAVADHFPRIGLTAFFGRASPELSMFASGGGTAWGIAGNLTGPLFQGGRLKGQSRQARAFWDESVAQYEQSILVALREVADALVSRQKLMEIESQQQIAVTSLTDAVGLAAERFTAGKAGYFEVLEAQQELFPAEQALADTQTQQLLAYVQLYKALGGGWNLRDDGWESVIGQPDAGVAPPAIHEPSTAADVSPATIPDSQPDE